MEDVNSLIQIRINKINEIKDNLNINPFPYNYDVIANSKELFITEGEFDCLSLIQVGYTNSVSLPTGANNSKWFEEHIQELEHIKKFIICPFK